ncbi:twin-arginine translocase subunit TatC [Halorarius litoreus]|uniref:twin-arginine translocase subunit TatC n=1 Tax=Halorarius litoreus TaxID=2962676 RepID=UPI0025768BFA|nr:twin-arginine translocase subunit TatC [Halorarius litoreus]
MAEEPGDDRADRESTESAPDGSPDADHHESTDEEPSVRPDEPADESPGDAPDDDEEDDPVGDSTPSSDDASDDGEEADDEVPSVTTDEEFNTLAADDEEDDGEADDDLGDITDAYGLPESNTTDEEQARWAGDERTADDPAADDPTADDAALDAPASDGGYADDDPYATYDDYELGGEVDDEVGVHEGAPDDQEMPLADHIEEMVKRLGVVVIVMAVVSGIVFPFGEDLINFLWYSYLPGTVGQCPEAAATAQDLGPGDAACPRVYHPLAVILARLKVATLAGFLVALPVFVYETYLFMRPGLYPKERRYYLASVPTSLVLAAVGVAFAHFLVIPAIFTYFVYYSDSATTIAFGLAETFDLMVLLMGGFAIVFQIPLFIMLALMMGLVTRQWMADRRLIFWGVYAGLAFLFSPDPTGMAPIIVAATMITLHEGTLLLAKWTGRK